MTRLQWQSERPNTGSVTSFAKPKRRARGLKRQKEILDAAEQVFVEIGYEDANTNLIAERAGCSPGTLYQFFKNKEQIAETIATEYARKLQEIQPVITDPSRHASFDDAVDGVIEGHLKFLRKAPAYGVLIHATNLGSEVRGVGPVLRETSTQRIAAILKRRVPRLSDSDAHFYAEVCVRVFGAMLPLLQHSNTRIRRRASEEMKEIARRYLAPIARGR